MQHPVQTQSWAQHTRPSVTCLLPRSSFLSQALFPPPCSSHTNCCPLDLAAAQHLLTSQVLLLLFLSMTPFCFPLLYVHLIHCPAWVPLHMAVGTPFSFPSLRGVYTSIPGPISHTVQPLFTVYLPYRTVRFLTTGSASYLSWSSRYQAW